MECSCSNSITSCHVHISVSCIINLTLEVSPTPVAILQGCVLQYYVAPPLFVLVHNTHCFLEFCCVRQNTFDKLLECGKVIFRPTV